MILLIAFNSMVFIALSGVHVYWAFGGRWALDAALPTRPDGRFLLKPSSTATFIVGFGLLFFAIITVGNFGLFDRWMDRQYVHFGTWAITILFTLRAIGDFKFVGFTKKTKHTKFAIRDTRIYSPLCLILSLFSLIISLKPVLVN